MPGRTAEQFTAKRTPRDIVPDRFTATVNESGIQHSAVTDGDLNPELEMVLSTLTRSLQREYRLDGEVRPLTAFSGVVENSAEGEYYEWSLASFLDHYGIQLRSESGRVKTYGLSDFASLLDDGGYVPALRTENHEIEVAAASSTDVASGI
jgi:hypothetical protein